MLQLCLVSTKSARLVFTGRIPSLKNGKRIIRFRGRPTIVSSLKWLKYEREFIRITPQAKIAVKPPYKITYKIYMKAKAATDMDNIITGVNDLLQKVNYITDDKHILKIHAEKFKNQKEYKTEVKIEHISDNE